MKTLKKLLIPFLLALLLAAVTIPALAANGDSAAPETAVTETQTQESGGAIAMGMAVSKSAEGISRQPEAEGKIRTTLMLGLVFIETAIIYALLVVILIIFVL